MVGPMKTRQPVSPRALRAVSDHAHGINSPADMGRGAARFPRAKYVREKAETDAVTGGEFSGVLVVGGCMAGKRVFSSG